MKTRTNLVPAFVGLFVALIAGVGIFRESSAQKRRIIDSEIREQDEIRRDLPQNAQVDSFGYENYEASTILRLDYGEGDNQAGLIVGVEDFRPMGPMSFALKGEAIYILDEVNARAKAFNRSGALIRSVDVDQGASDIAVDSNDRLYVLESRTNSLAEYELGSDSATRYSVKQPIEGLSEHANDVVAVKTSDSKSYSLKQSVGRLTLRLSPEPFTCIQVGNHSGRVTNNSTGKAFSVITENSFGSIAFLGTDREQNIYIVVEELLTADTIQVVKQVRKYTASGKQLATIPINIDYVAHPEKELILDEDGSVYHLLPLKEHLIVQKWTRKY